VDTDTKPSAAHEYSGFINSFPRPVSRREPIELDRTRRGASVGKSKHAEYAKYIDLRYGQYVEYISGSCTRFSLIAQIQESPQEITKEP
jgi:hypothetical protein